MTPKSSHDPDNLMGNDAKYGHYAKKRNFKKTNIHEPGHYIPLAEDSGKRAAAAGTALSASQWIPSFPLKLVFCSIVKAVSRLDQT